MKKYLFLALILAPIGFFTHLAFISMTLSQKEKVAIQEEEKEIRAKNLELVKSYIEKTVRIARNMPPVPSVETACPAELPQEVPYAATDPKFFEHFASGVYTKLPPHPESDTWYWAQPFKDLLDRLDRVALPEKPENWDAGVVGAVKNLERSRYFLIVYPTRFVWPTVDKKEESFVSGYFDGWQALMDASNGKILCQQRLQVQNSESVKFSKQKLRRVVTVYNNMEKKVREDFVDNFWKAVAANLAKRSTP